MFLDYRDRLLSLSFKLKYLHRMGDKNTSSFEFSNQCLKYCKSIVVFILISFCCFNILLINM